MFKPYTKYKVPYLLSLALSLVLAAMIMLSVYINRASKLARQIKVINKLAGAGVEAQNNAVIPLTWDSSTGTYLISLLIGNDTVTAAFDTGSAECIIATEKCDSCTSSVYSPAPPASAIVDSQSPSSLCQSKKYYGSQTDTVQMYSDTVTIQRVLATPCAKQSTVEVGTKPPEPIIIPDFPIGGIIRNTGSSSSNVFGISGIKCVTKAADGQEYLLPSCQTTEESQFISSLLESFRRQSSRTGTLVWSISVAPSRSDGAIVGFASRPPACEAGKGQVVYTPAVKTIPDAPESLAVPWMYYTIEVTQATDIAGNPYPGFPKYLLVDTGTSAFLVPGSQSTVSSLNTNGLVLTLAGPGNSTLKWEPTKDPQDNNIFSLMAPALATGFSASQSVGIMGCLAMRGRYIEFTFGKPRMVGFA